MSFIQAIPQVSREGYQESPARRIGQSDSFIYLRGDVAEPDLSNPAKTMTFGYLISVDNVLYARWSSSTWVGNLINKQGIVSQPYEQTDVSQFRGWWMKLFVEIPIGNPVVAGAQIEIT